MCFVVLVIADPQRRESTVQQVERDAAHAFKFRLVDLGVEIRIDSHLRDGEVVRVCELRLRHVLFALLLGHAEMKPE